MYKLKTHETSYLRRTNYLLSKGTLSLNPHLERIMFTSKSSTDFAMQKLQSLDLIAGTYWYWMFGATAHFWGPTRWGCPSGPCVAVLMGGTTSLAPYRLRPERSSKNYRRDKTGSGCSRWVQSGTGVAFPSVCTEPLMPGSLPHFEFWDGRVPVRIWRSAGNGIRSCLSRVSQSRYSRYKRPGNMLTVSSMSCESTTGDGSGWRTTPCISHGKPTPR